MRYTYPIIALVVLVFSGCGGSTDDTPVPEEENTVLKTKRARFSLPVSLIYSDQEQDMLVSLNTGGEVVETINLTRELELPA